MEETSITRPQGKENHQTISQNGLLNNQNYQKKVENSILDQNDKINDKEEKNSSLYHDNNIKLLIKISKSKEKMLFSHLGSIKKIIIPNFKHIKESLYQADELLNLIIINLIKVAISQTKIKKKLKCIKLVNSIKDLTDNIKILENFKLLLKIWEINSLKFDEKQLIHFKKLKNYISKIFIFGLNSTKLSAKKIKNYLDQIWNSFYVRLDRYNSKENQLWVFYINLWYEILISITVDQIILWIDAKIFDIIKEIERAFYKKENNSLAKICDWKWIFQIQLLSMILSSDRFKNHQYLNYRLLKGLNYILSSTYSRSLLPLRIEILKLIKDHELLPIQAKYYLNNIKLCSVKGIKSNTQLNINLDKSLQITNEISSQSSFLENYLQISLVELDKIICNLTDDQKYHSLIIKNALSRILSSSESNVASKIIFAYLKKKKSYINLSKF